MLKVNKLTKKLLNVMILSMLKTLTKPILNIIYPLKCVHCNALTLKDDKHLCDECFYSLARQTPPFCLKCGRSINQEKDIKEGICLNCKTKNFHFDKAWSICSYEGLIRDLIHNFKYRQKLQYQYIFKSLINEFLETYKILNDIDIIIPIPLHATRLREREYNQSQILANIVSETINKPILSDTLIRIKNTKPQIELSDKQRIQNISGCFAIRNQHAINSGNILLIDDVFTTGATISEAARIIKEYNPGKIFALTLAC